MRTDDQHQPAAVAPRLSPEREVEIRAELIFGLHGVPYKRVETVMLQEALDELDATRAQHADDRRMLRLAVGAQKDRAEQAEADLARARAEAEALMNLLTDVRDGTGNRWSWDQNAAYEALAAPQSEQTAAPVDRSAAAPIPCPQCHTMMRPPQDDLGGVCVVCWRRNNGEWPSLIPLVTITPPDHQAGNEPDV